MFLSVGFILFLIAVAVLLDAGCAILILILAFAGYMLF